MCVYVCVCSPHHGHSKHDHAEGFGVTEASEMDEWMKVRVCAVIHALVCMHDNYIDCFVFNRIEWLSVLVLHKTVGLCGCVNFPARRQYHVGFAVVLGQGERRL